MVDYWINRSQKYLKWYVTISIMTICSHLTGQYQQLFFDRISLQEGLSNSSINYILQDHNGFMWFATSNGLNRYDGFSFKVFTNDIEDSTSISSNFIYSLCEDREGYIWVVNGRNTGLDRYDPRKEEFEHFIHNPNDPNSISSNEIFSVVEDRKGNIWISTADYLNCYPKQVNGQYGKAKFERYAKPKGGVRIDYVFENKYNELCVFTDKLYYFDIEKKRFIDAGVGFLVNPGIRSLIELDNGDLLLGTFGGILKLEYQGIGKGYRSGDTGKLSVAPRARTCLYLDHNKHLWIGTELHGLYRYRFDADILDHFLPDEFDNKSISDRTIFSLFEDKTGVLWIGTFSQGLCKYDLYRKQFMHFYKIPHNTNSLSGNIISSIRGINSEELWVGLDVGGGVNRILFSENDKPRVIHYLNDPNNPNTISKNSALSLVQRKDGNVWVGSTGDLSRITPEAPFSGKEPKIKNYKFGHWTFSMYEDSDGTLWGGTWGGGLWRYDDKTDSFDFFKNDTTNKYSIPENVIWSISEDRYKNIWIGGNGKGIAILTADEKMKKSPRFLHFMHEKNKSGSLSNNTINAICEAGDGTIWIGTINGLNKVLNYDKISGRFQDFPELKFKSYYTKDGLPNDGIVGVVEDDNGNLWMSTGLGISKMNPHTCEFKNYTEEQGLQSNDFWHNAYYKNSKGMLFFGGKNGFNAFYPDQISSNPFKPDVMLTELKLFDKIVGIGDTVNGQVILTKAINQTQEIVLNHKNNIITFEFAALHFVNSAQNNYSYYLEGFEENWNISSKKRFATYTNLNPGRYTFRVKASNNDGIWSEKEIALKVIVLTPWWNSLFIKILESLLIAVFVLWIFRVRVRILKKQKRDLEDTVEMRTNELQQANTLLEEKQEEIICQNEELVMHRDNLERMVEERTRELEEAKRKAEVSDRLKSSFLANMSHEIRTPMNAIMGFSTLLKEKDFSEQEKEEFIDSINVNGESLLVLINDILDMSMIEANQVALSFENVNINEILRELERYFNLKNDRELVIEYENRNEEDLSLITDPVRFRQIMNNLIVNALKYTQKGFIKFGYNIKESEICFYVSDSGIGISSEYLESIFEHFYKIEFETTKLYRGAGIGLAICKKLVNMLNGKIWVESVPNKGSIFYFTLPIRSTVGETKMVKEKGNIDTVFNWQNLFFVIAEDEITNYEVMAKMLRIPQDRHFWAKNGKEVVDFVKGLDTYEGIIVLMDIKMPIMNGVEAMQQIKNINDNIPVIAVTAFALKHEEQDFLHKGFDGFIAKPFKIENLKQVISKYID